MKRSIAWETSLALGGIILVLLSVVEGFFYLSTQRLVQNIQHDVEQNIQQTLETQKIAQIESLQQRIQVNARILGDVMGPYVFRGPFLSDLDDRTMSLAAYLDFPEIQAIRVINAEGVAFAAVWRQEDKLGRGKDFPPMLPFQDWQKIEQPTMFAGRPVGIVSMYYTDRLLLQELNRLSEQAFRSIREEQQRLQRRWRENILWQLLGILVIGLVAIVGFNSLASRVIVRPIQSLADVARAIQAGEFSRTARSDRQDEIGALATAFNSMTHQLSQSLKELMGINERLRREIAERQRAEAESLQKQQFIERIFRAIPSFIAIIDLLEGNKLVYINDEAVHFFGYTTEEMLNMGDVISRLVHPDDHKIVEDTIRTAIERNIDDVYTIEFRVKPKDGQWTWVHWRGTLFKRTPDGRIWQSIGSLHDITQLKETENALRASEQQYRLLVQNVTEGIGIIQDGKLIFANNALAAMLGYPADKLLGKTPVELFGRNSDYKAHFDKMSEHLQQSIADPRWQVAEFAITADQQERYMEGCYSIILWEGQPATLVRMQDITARKQKEREQEQERKRLQQENLQLKATMKDRYKLGDIIGKSLAMQTVYELMIKAAATDAPVVIYGESGTGKDLVAHTIHQMSKRQKRPFVPVNCGSIQETLFESEFFGHRKGAFTGAHKDKPGFFDAAHGGTLFLDEVGELSLAMQVKLLRALEGGGYTPVGDHVLKHADVRLIAATNRDLKKQVKQRLMRADFFYRLNVITITVPPLREHREDIPLLLEHFLSRYNRGKDQVLPGRVVESFYHQDWPGNIRQFQNALQRYLSLNRLDFDDEILLEQSEGRDLDHPNLEQVVDEFEKNLILKVLHQHHWHRAETAAALGTTVRTLHRKMQKYQLGEMSSSPV